MTAPRDEVRAGAGLRLLRAAVFAAACVALAAAGHALASCATVSAPSLLAGFALAFLVAAALAGRRRTLPPIAALLAGGQLVLHTLFGLGQHPASGQGATAGGARSVAEQAAQLLCGVPASALAPEQARRILLNAGLDPTATPHTHGPAPAPAPVTYAHDLLPSPGMTLAHLFAALLAGWLLRHGELALFRLVALSAHGAAESALLRSLRTALLGALTLQAERYGAPGRVRARWRGSEEVPAPRCTYLEHSVIRRGPPAAGGFLLAA